MNHEKKVAIVVCGIQNHIPLLNKLKARGYYTILVDYLDEPRAKEAADEHVQISTFDFDGIEKLAIDRKAELIINACQEHLNIGICKIAEKLGLPHPYSSETAYDISNKEHMKARMVEYNIPTTPYICVSDPEEVKDFSLKFPVYVKSCEGAGSTAVNRASDIEEVKVCIKKALNRYPGKKVIVEEEAFGHEYNVYCYPNNGKANVLMIARRCTDNQSEDHVTKLLATFAPPLISEKARQVIYDTADKITRAFKLENVPMFMQIMVNGDQINVIEFAGRMSGGFGYQAIFEGTGLDEFEATINSFLRIPNHIAYKESKDYITVSTVYADPCILDEVTGYQELLNDGTLSDIMLPRLPGTEIKAGSPNGSCVAFLIHRDKTIDGLVDKIERTFNHIEVIGTDGKSHLKKELRLTKDIIYS